MSLIGKLPVSVPSGVNVTQSQDMSLGVGNVVDNFTVNSKGVATLLQASNLKTVKIGPPKDDASACGGRRPVNPGGGAAYPSSDESASSGSGSALTAGNWCGRPRS